MNNSPIGVFGVITVNSVITIGLILMFLLIIVTVVILFSENKDKMTMRMEQHRSKRSAKLYDRMETNLKNKSSKKYRYKIETLCLQSGFSIKFGEYILLCMLSSIAVPLFAIKFLNNPFIAVSGVFLGWVIPGQVLSMFRNLRLNKMETQVGSFLNMLTERYKVLEDLPRSITETLGDFQGQEPIFSEISKTIAEMETNETPLSALKNMSRRTGNKYLNRFCDFYETVLEIGTNEQGLLVLEQAYLQYEENCEMKDNVKKAIAASVRDTYIMLAAIPIMIIYQVISNEDYVSFMTTETVGRVGSAIIFYVLLGAFWVINTKLAAPIDSD